MRVVILSLFLMVLLLSIKDSKGESPARYCGSTLPQILYLVCSGEYAEKRAKNQNPLIQFIKDWHNIGSKQSIDAPDPQADTINDPALSLLPNELDSTLDLTRYSLMPAGRSSEMFDYQRLFPRAGVLHRVRRQIHDECCLRPCTFSHIKKYYCANGR